ncbi:hypothetical protein [Actinophytocola sp.]|uniref:hypothetical protein n=1 Tax=Actinophytocola sp. TaxID=1872138 RepID=UPI003D6AEB10
MNRFPDRVSSRTPAPAANPGALPDAGTLLRRVNDNLRANDMPTVAMLEVCDETRSMPLGATGKVLKRLLRERYALADGSRAAARTPTAHFDDMTFNHAPGQALFSAMLPFLPDPPAGRDQVYVVLPWRPRWRLPAIGVLFVIAAVGTATSTEEDTAGGVLGMIGRLGLLAVILLAYYLRGSRVVAVDVHTARGLRKARSTCYLAAIGAAVGLIVLYSIGF